MVGRNNSHLIAAIKWPRRGPAAKAADLSGNWPAGRLYLVSVCPGLSSPGMQR